MPLRKGGSRLADPSLLPAESSPLVLSASCKTFAMIYPDARVRRQECISGS